MRFKKRILLFLVVVGCAQISVSTLTESEERRHNSIAVALPAWDEMLDIAQRFIFVTDIDQSPSEAIQVNALTRQQLEALPKDKISAVRFGHSTVLLKINGEFWLTDPVFSDRLGPVYFMGIERFHPTPMSIEELPNIQGVLISHNHYDHLDERTITALKAKVRHFAVPLGNGKKLIDWGVDPSKISAFDWWESKKIGELTITSTPANHISGRMLVDQNDALWSSWVITSESHNIFFSGDGGYSDVFKEIGEKLGPFDLTLMENGSYDKAWSKEHLTPAETILAHQDLKGKLLLPIHNSTFDMAFHPWHEPLSEVSRLAKQQSISLLTPEFGKVLTLDNTTNTDLVSENSQWWQQN